MQCEMCFVRVDAAAIQASGKRERTADEWIQMAQQAASAGTLTLLLTGGEVTIRPDFPRIYEAIAQMGFLTTVYTNATNVTDELMALFEKYPPHQIGVTMYGASPETYQRVCGHADGYDRFLCGVRKLKTLPSQLDMRTTLIQKNVADYPAMKAFTAQSFGENKVLHVSSRIFNTTRGGIGSPVQVRLSPLAHTQFFYSNLYHLNRLLEDGQLSASAFPDFSKLKNLERSLKRRQSAPDGSFIFSNCGAGIHEYFISWSGEMYACGTLPVGCTQPFETGFERAWEDLPSQYPLAKQNETCKSCDLRAYCESCPAFRMLETGSWDGTPQFACDTAKFMKQILEPLFTTAGSIPQPGKDD